MAHVSRLSSRMVTYLVFLSVLLRVDGMPHQLTLTEDTEVMNPVEILLHRPPQTIAEQFTDQLMEELKAIRHHCEEMEASVEREMEGRLRNLSLYQEYINDILNDQYKNLSSQEKQQIQDDFHLAFERLYTEEQLKEGEISLNCTAEFETIMADKMSIALEYAKRVLQQSTSDFATLVSDVMMYNSELTRALALCLSNYPSTTDVVNPLMKGSSSYKCKQIEIQILSQFVYEFIIKSANLLAGQDIGSELFGSVPTTLQPEIFPRPEIPNQQKQEGDEGEESEPIVLVDPEMTPTKETSRPHPPQTDHTHGPEGTHHKHGGHHGDRPHPHNHGDDRPHNDDGNRPNDDNQPHPPNHDAGDGPRPPNDDDNQPHPPSHDDDQPHHDDNQLHPPTPDVTSADHFNIHVVPVESPDDPTDSTNVDHSFGILVVSGFVSAVLFVLIVVVGVLILGIKYHRYRSKGWSDLTEEEKVVAMKQSGYVNPTYEFFDKVTQ